MWQIYEVNLYFTGNLMGGIPKHPDVIKSWLEARAPSDVAFQRMPAPISLTDLAIQVAVEVGATNEAENKVWTGFKGDENGLYVDGYHAKAHLKDCANILQATLGIKALKSKLADRVFVIEEKIYLGKSQPDGYWEHPVHIMTMQGPRSALKRNDYVAKPHLVFHLKVLDDKVITEKILNSLFEFGETHGFGAERGLGNGRYTFTLKLT